MSRKRVRAVLITTPDGKRRGVLCVAGIRWLVAHRVRLLLARMGLSKGTCKIQVGRSR